MAGSHSVHCIQTIFPCSVQWAVNTQLYCQIEYILYLNVAMLQCQTPVADISDVKYILESLQIFLKLSFILLNSYFAWKIFIFTSHLLYSDLQTFTLAKQITAAFCNLAPLVI